MSKPQTFTVEYFVRYTTTLTCTREELEAMIDIMDIPEEDNNEYVDDSFEVYQIFDEDEKRVKI